MYLKKLESVGFKSFAERISVEFVPGVTAVVGPNGSGKSNITDAIRWVLGEQSAKSLRGAKMEDIIFQGSDTRKALNFAEVTLVLDNKDKAVPLDYDEISITRRVYRSGESEFYINKQSCRLKDIIDLFMDSGLGREAFSIISQGKVEEILSSKAEERRAIFEEAAGVLKYKQRKKKSEYKLAETQENLNRVEDIIHEIESQIKPLKEQEEKAKIYLKLKEKLKKEEISLLITEIEKIHIDWEDLKEKIKQEELQAIEVQTEINKKEAWLEKQKQDNQKLDQVIEELQEQRLESTKQLESLEGKKELFLERTKHFTENKQKLSTQKQESEQQVNLLKDQIRKEKEQLAVLQEARKTSIEKIKNYEEKLDRSRENIHEQIEDLKSEYIESLNEQAAIRNEKQSMDRQLQQLRGREQVQADKFKDTLELREALEKKKNDHELKMHEETERVAKKEQSIVQLKSKAISDRKHFQEMQTKLYKGFQYIEKMKSRKEMLEEMKEDYQGFFHGVKSILKAKKDRTLNEIEGAVIELTQVPKSYITAVETVLGGQAQHIITQNESAARRAISWLKKTNNGRATFLPLDKINERYVPENILNKVRDHQGFIGVAAELVQTEEKYRKAIQHLMGHVLIAESLKDATDIAGISGRRYRIITLDGDVINPGGAISGGAQKKTNQSLFTRDKELEEINDKLTNYETRVEAFSKNVNQQQEKMEDAAVALEKAEVEIVQEQKYIQALKTINYEIEMDLKSLNDNLTNYDQEERQFKEDIEYLNKRNIELGERHGNVKEKLEYLQMEIDKLTLEESQFKENVEQTQLELQDTKLINAKEEERYRHQYKKIEELKLQLQTIQDNLSNYTNELSELLQLVPGESTVGDIDDEILEEKENNKEITEAIQEQRAARTESTVKIEDTERELREENKINQEIRSFIQQKEVQVNRLDVELENRLQQLQTDYTITFERARQEYQKTEHMDKAKLEVSTLKQKIINLGTVNLGSIEEYERISERYEFLTEQQTDLNTAKDTLYRVIHELDTEMKERFETTFSAIKEEFTIVFKELFGGGNAALKLTDPKDILETGVDIIAQPPGKKLQHLGLLSGGERALTAIALLFAILRVRPVPFCILDEVEAALDEANVMRFARYLKEYSEETQFIVITHRKGTMEEADVLYGVTMQESGVSRLVSVNMEEIELPANDKEAVKDELFK